MRALLLTIVVLFLVAGCQSKPKPGLSLSDAKIAEGPVLIQRGDHFYLRYRRELEPNGLTLFALLCSKKSGDKVYYYFSTRISHPEWGNLVERPLAFDGYEEQARLGQVFWLDPDGKTHAIPIEKK
jgi:hypothetical protein